MENDKQSELISLLKDFYNLTKIKICVFDSFENEIAYYPEQLCSFCKYVRNNEEINNKCIKCDKNSFAICRKTLKTYTYICHMGLLECVSPILYNEKINGFIMIGQIHNEKINDFSTICNSINYFTQINYKKAESLYNNLPIESNEKISSAIHIIKAISSYLYLKNLIKENVVTIDQKLRNYIKKHITEKIGVNNLCKEFKLSRTELYNIFSSYFSSTVNDFIIEQRLLTAEELLKTTKLSIDAISEKCGFNDYNYFTKVYKKNRKITPSAFRKDNII